MLFADHLNACSAVVQQWMLQHAWAERYAFYYIYLQSGLSQVYRTLRLREIQSFQKLKSQSISRNGNLMPFLPDIVPNHGAICQTTKTHATWSQASCSLPGGSQPFMAEHDIWFYRQCASDKLPWLPGCYVIVSVHCGCMSPFFRHDTSYLSLQLAGWSVCPTLILIIS